MIIFACISITFLIIIEILLTIFCCLKLKKIKRKVNIFNEKVKIFGEELIIAIKTFRKNITKINKAVKFLSSRKMFIIQKILKFSLNIIQVLIFLKTINFKGKKTFTKKNIEKVIISQITKSIIWKLLNLAC